MSFSDILKLIIIILIIAIGAWCLIQKQKAYENLANQNKDEDDK